jgi:hypothetical protein
MTYADCPHVSTAEVLGDSRIHTDHLGKVLAIKYALKFRGDAVIIPDDPTPRKLGLLARIFT